MELTTSVYDTGEPPGDVDLQRVTLLNNPNDFYQQTCDLFHLALHPEHRQGAFEILLQRSLAEPICVLCEKPMAAPESPGDCQSTAEAIRQSQAVVLYDFPELFDPITQRILDFFGRYDDVRIESMEFQRSKDREDPGIRRNEKRMVHIQYQESVHCLAFALYLLAHLHGGLESVLRNGLLVQATSQAYQPPNPSAYPYVVDGKCDYCLSLGDTRIDGRTDFTRGAPWEKRRAITGTVDGRAFSIEAHFLEGDKRLLIDGEPNDDVVHTDSYAEVIQAISRLRQHASRREIMSGVHPNPTFARLTFQLSSLLWKSCWEREAMEVDSLPALLAFDAGFADAQPRFPRY